MIKSSDARFDNTYRILRVLSNKDYLAIDQQHRRFIFCQKKNTPTNSTSLKHPITTKNHNTHLLHHTEIIEVNDVSYFVFQMPSDSLIYVRDIPVKKLESSKFVVELFSEAITHILGEFLWVSPRQAGKILDIRNFWLSNNQLNVLMMPRSKKEYLSLKRTQQKRSKSQESSFLDHVIEKEVKIIGQFGKVLEEILQPQLVSKGQERIWSVIKKILTQMITRNISYEEILLQLKDLQSQIHLKKISKSVYIRSLEKKNVFPRRYTLEPSFLSRNSTNKRTVEIITPLKAKCKTEVIMNSLKVESCQKDSQVKRKLFDTGASRFKKRWYLNFNTKSKSVRELVNQDNEKEKSKLSTIDPSGVDDNKKYLTWMRGKKKGQLNLHQTILHRKQAAQKKFHQHFSKSYSSIESNAKRLKERLFSKALQIKYKKSETKQDVPTIQPSIPAIGSEINKEKDEKIDHTLQQNLSLKEENLKELSAKVVDSSQPQAIAEEKIDELTFYNVAHNFSKKISQKEQSGAQKMQAKSSVEQKKQKELKLSSIPIQKMKRMKSHQIQNYKGHNEEDEIQTVTLSKNINTKDIPPEAKEQSNLKSTTINNETLTVEKNDLNPVFQEQVTKQSSRNLRLKKVSEAIREFITLINILGNLCVHIVKNKNRLTSYQWRKSVYFLYQRFFTERTKLLKNLQSNSREIVRQTQQIEPQAIDLWHHSRQKTLFVEQIKKQNSTISQTYKQFSLKALQQCSLQPMIRNFIQNRQQILEKESKKNRMFVSKYAVAHIINEYDEVIERKMFSEETLDYIWRSLFGLRILAQLDDKDHELSKGISKEYEEEKKSWEQGQKWVERIYELYYPETEEKLQF